VHVVEDVHVGMRDDGADRPKAEIDDTDELAVQHCEIKLLQ
jgi:hypothetical protein